MDKNGGTLFQVRTIRFRLYVCYRLVFPPLSIGKACPCYVSACSRQPAKVESSWHGFWIPAALHSTMLPKTVIMHSLLLTSLFSSPSSFPRSKKWVRFLAAALAERRKGKGKGDPTVQYSTLVYCSTTMASSSPFLDPPHFLARAVIFPFQRVGPMPKTRARKKLEFTPDMATTPLPKTYCTHHNVSKKK